MIRKRRYNRQTIEVVWNKERTNILTRLWTNGKSALEIAETLGGVTRKEVISKAYRLGLSAKKLSALPKRRYNDIR